MNKKDIIKGVITNIVIPVITAILMMLVLKMNINLENFVIVFIFILVIFFLGDLGTM